MSTQAKFECPLCHSRLSELKYLNVLGVWQEQERFKASLKTRLAEAAKAKNEAKALKSRLALQFERQLEAIRKRTAAETNRRVSKLTKSMEARIGAAERRERHAATERRRLLASLERLRHEAKVAEKRGELKAERNARALVRRLETQISQSRAASRQSERDKAKLSRDFRGQIRRVQIVAAEKGKAEIRKANDKVLKTVRAKEAQIEHLSAQNKNLHDQIRRGVTQQVEGLNFEKVLATELRSRFRGDSIQQFGKGGDILHSIHQGSKVIGAILYECKKTDKWSNNFLKQVKRDMVAREADYGVVVTFALPRSARGFLVRSGVSFIHPYGAMHLADVLRTTLVELNNAKLSPGKVEQKLKDLMVYVQGTRFKGALRQVIGETQELVEAMKREMLEHRKFWLERHARYRSINQSASRVKTETVEILKGKGPERLLGQAASDFLPMPMLSLEKLGRTSD